MKCIITRHKQVYIVFNLLIAACLPSSHTNSKATDFCMVIFNHYKPAYVQNFADSIAAMCHLKSVRVLHASLPANAITNIKHTRFRADSLLNFLSAKAQQQEVVLGITNKDISCTKVVDGRVKTPAAVYTDWGVMGLARCPGKAGVVSTFRLKCADNEVFKTRLFKVMLHETGHMLGLPHCSNKNCVMTDAAEKISTIDNATSVFCKSCNNHLLAN